MNINLYNFYGFIALFPIWIFRGNLGIIDISILLSIFLLLPFFLHIKLFNIFFKKKKLFVIYIWLSLITFYSIDQNFGLWLFSGIITKIINFQSPYYYSLFFSVLSIFFLTSIFFILKKNAVKICFAVILTLFIFNVLDYTKNLSNFPLIDNNKENKNFNILNKNKKLIIVFDEMSGLESRDNKVENGDYINNYILKFFLKNNFNVYVNARSLFRSTDKALSSSLNFITNLNDYKKIDINKDKQYINKSKNYFIVNDLTKNKLFDLEEHQNIIVHQSMFLNYCKHRKVTKCYQFNPFDKNLFFLKGFKNTFVTRYISVYKNNGSIFSNYVWRLTREIKLGDSLLDPEGEKASIEYILNQIFNSVNFEKTSLIFAHILVPHIPYGFDKNCNYDGTKSIDYNNISINEKRIRHNIEKYCLIKYLDVFFENLKKAKNYDKLEIIIFSDHDSRITNLFSTDKQINNVIFVHKKNNSKKSNLITKNISLNEILSNLMNSDN
tara:strand:+ start:379 stop:1866 length:1488 start_codon:yes stop_codon:yes gene_type:complete